MQKSEEEIFLEVTVGTNYVGMVETYVYRGYVHLSSVENEDGTVTSRFMKPKTITEQHHEV